MDDKKVHTVIKNISSKVKVKARLKLGLADFEAAAAAFVGVVVFCEFLHK